MNVDLYYLKSNNQLYAFTTDKTYSLQFRSQRNKALFIHKRVKIPKCEYHNFESDNYHSKLDRILLYDGKHDFEIIGTIEEDSKLDSVCTKIHDKLDYYHHYFSSKLNNEYLNVINDATKLIKESDKACNSYLEINTFDLFCYLFRFTFISNDYEIANAYIDSL